MAQIKLENVGFTYNGAAAPAIRNVNLEIEEGEVVVLTGPSGCGKTSIIRLINGLIPFYWPGKLEGSVRVIGHESRDGNIYDMGSMVGTVFQNPRSQFFCVDVMSELAFGAENRNIAKSEILKRIDRASELLDMGNLLDRTMFQLSGGEKQKIACACVSVTEAPIAVLDEPSSNLDARAVRELRETIGKWKAEGKTVVIAEHRLEYLKDIADRFIYVSGGEIKEIFSRDEFRKLSMEELSMRGLRTLSYDGLTINGSSRDDGILELCDFNFTYRGQKEPSLMIDRLSIPKGAVIGIIGHNGAGKSTFVRALCGLQKHTHGMLWEDGKRYARRRRLDRSFLVMQDVNHQLFTESVEEEITLSMETPDPERLDELLREFDIAEFRDKHPMALSGGQKQRVAVASAIASERDFIVFDEPTSGLDLVHMKEVASCIKDLQSRGKTVFLITHDIELLYACSSCILLMEKGKVKDAYPLNKGTERRLRSFFLDEKGN